MGLQFRQNTVTKYLFIPHSLSRRRIMKTIKFVAVSLVAMLLVAVTSPVAKAADFYAGITWIQYENSTFGLVVRFKAYDGSFTLQEAEAIYTALHPIVTNLGGQYGVYTSTKSPSEALAEGITGELLWDSFLVNGNGLLTINNEPVDQLLFLSLYDCFYQGADHMCIRTYIHTGDLNLSSIGVPYNMVVGLGAVVVATPIWDSLMSILPALEGLL